MQLFPAENSPYIAERVHLDRPNPSGHVDVMARESRVGPMYPVTGAKNVALRISVGLGDRQEHLVGQAVQKA
jgi:hypothetical protein